MPLVLFKHSQIFLTNPHKNLISDKSSHKLGLASQIFEIIETIPHQEYIKTFKICLERIRLCLENKGDYFEHLKNKI